MSDFITLTIDGQEVRVRKGARVLEAAQEAGIYIPTLCNHPLLDPYAGCRLCIVEIEKMRGLPTACSTPATDGMVVYTDTLQVQQLRREIMELLLTQHPHPCLTCHRLRTCGPFDTCLRHVSVTDRCVLCPKNKRCEFQDVARDLGMEQITLPDVPRNLPIEAGDPFYDRDYNLCILCGRCVRVCDEVRGVKALAFTFRGMQALVGTAYGRNLREAGCIFCGACVDACPTGALVERASRWEGPPEREVITVCPYCGVGCQLKLQTREGRLLRCKPDPEGPSNWGMACVKGKFGLDFVHSPDRLTTPLIRKNGRLEEASWEEALSLVAERFSRYRGHEVAVISSAKCTNEENYVVQKFARAVLGTNNVDHCARLCHSPSVAGLAQVFGSGAMTNSSADLAEAACFLVIGSDTTETHPVLSLQIVKALRQGAKLIVADPREIALCRKADLWLQQRPGSDVALLSGMARVILDEGLHDEQFIAERGENFEAFRDSLKAFDLATVERLTGVPAATIAEAARLYATSRPAAILYAMGITQHSHGTDNVFAVANLALLTGNIGKPGSGVNPLRGQNNVQGSCDMGALPNVFPGYQAVNNPEIRQKFEAAWGVTLPAEPGLTITEIFEAAAEGKIKALYQVGENPVLSDPDARHVEEALQNLEFFVVQDIFLTESARYAHVVLPAASFAEKEGTFTNTERRVQRVRKAVGPPGEARPDWWITCQIARRMGARGFDYADASPIMDEVARLTPSYGGLNLARLDKEGGLQWPCPTPEHLGTSILHTERFPRGKGRFTPLEYRAPVEEPNSEYPLVLTTARSYYHYHTGTMTRRVEGLNVIEPEERAALNPRDADALGIADGEWVEVFSRRGQVRARARVTETTPPGVITMSFHFAESPTNVLTSPALDPLSKMAELKVCAVRVEKVREERKVHVPHQV